MGVIGIWGWLAVPVCAAAGWWCAALALSYAECILQGAAIDGATLRLAWRRAWSFPGRFMIPSTLGTACAGLMAAASLSFVVQPGWLAVAHCAACAVLLTLAVIDMRCGLLPDALTLPLLWAGLLLAWAGVGVGLHDAVIAAATGYLLLRGLDVLFVIGRGQHGLGGGDMKLVAALGAWLGWAPLPMVLLLACLAGILFAMWVAGVQGWKATLAFGPFLALAGGAGLVAAPVVKLFF